MTVVLSTNEFSGTVRTLLLNEKDDLLNDLICSLDDCYLFPGSFLLQTCRDLVPG